MFLSTDTARMRVKDADIVLLGVKPQNVEAI